MPDTRHKKYVDYTTHLFSRCGIPNRMVRLSPKIAKVLAAGLIEALDVFLIAVVAQIIGLGLCVLFIDDTLQLPTWLKISNLDDLKSHLVSSVIAVLVLYLLVKDNKQ